MIISRSLGKIGKRRYSTLVTHCAILIGLIRRTRHVGSRSFHERAGTSQASFVFPALLSRHLPSSLVVDSVAN